MSIMYDDEKTWKEHYDDWNHIMLSLQEDLPTIVFRRKIIQNLIDDYDRNHE